MFPSHDLRVLGELDVKHADIIIGKKLLVVLYSSKLTDEEVKAAIRDSFIVFKIADDDIQIQRNDWLPLRKPYGYIFAREARKGEKAFNIGYNGAPIL